MSILVHNFTAPPVLQLSLINHPILFFAGNSNLLSRRFFFTVDNRKPEEYDLEKPECEIVEDTWSQNCAQIEQCAQGRWFGKFKVTDTTSGLKTVEESPSLGSLTWESNFGSENSYFSRDNFIIGSTDPAEFSFATSCCTNQVSLISVDLANNSNTCVAGSGQIQLSSAEVAVIVVAVVLVIVFISAVIGFLVIRKRRQAELSEMTSLPQER